MFFGGAFTKKHTLNVGGGGEFGVWKSRVQELWRINQKLTNLPEPNPVLPVTAKITVITFVLHDASVWLHITYIVVSKPNLSLTLTSPCASGRLATRVGNQGQTIT